MSEVRIQNVYQVTRDMDRAVAFYRDVLGLRMKFQDGEKWSQLTDGTSGLALSSPDEGAPADGGSVVVLEVGDLAAMRARLEAAGTDVLSERDMGGHGRVLACRDPDGTLIQLYQPAAR